MSFNKNQNPIQYLLNERSTAKIFPDNTYNPIRYTSMKNPSYDRYQSKKDYVKDQIEQTQLSPRTIREIERRFLENGQYNDQYRAEDVYLFSILLANEQLKHLGLSNDNLQKLCNLLMEARKQRQNADNGVNDKINKIIQRTYKLLFHLTIKGYVLSEDSQAEEEEYNSERKKYLELAENSKNDSKNIKWSKINSTMQAVAEELNCLMTNANNKYSKETFAKIISYEDYFDHMMACYTFKPAYQHLRKVADINSAGRFLFKNNALTNKLLIFLPSQSINAIIKQFIYYLSISNKNGHSRITTEQYHALNECIENFNNLEKMRRYAEKLQAAIDDEDKQKAGKKLATVCRYLTNYNSQKKASPEARACLKKAIDQTYRFAKYYKNGKTPTTLMKDKLAYENIANELGKFFEPRGRWALLGWLGIVLLLFTGFALSPLTGGLSGVAATAVSAAIIPAGTVGGIGTIGGWGIFARRKYKVSQMRSLPNTFFPPQSTKVDDKTLSHEIDDDESQLDLSLTSAL